ncbi:hypothetical protein MCEMSEM23_03066 [Rhabdaerophilaceae bacterium]
MDNKPAEGETPAANTSSPARPASRGRSRLPSDIDLPASSVADVAATTAEAAPSDPASSTPMPDEPPAPPPAKSPMLVPALVGLVAGMVGGFGAWQAQTFMGTSDVPIKAIGERVARLESTPPSPAPAPVPPPTPIPVEVTEGLARAEKTLADMQAREAVIRAEMGKLADALGVEQAERTKAVAELSARASAPAPAIPQTAPVAPSASTPTTPLADLAPELNQLRSRLTALEGAAKALPDAIGAVAAKNEAASGKVDTLMPRIDALAQRVDAYAPGLASVNDQVASLSKSLAGVASRDELTRAAALIVSANLASDLVQRSEKLGSIPATLRALGAPEPLLASLDVFAEVAPPSASTLLTELRRLSAPAPSAQAPAADMIERLRQGAASLVDIRRTGEISGTDDAAHLARAEQALQSGDLALALTLTGRLTADRAPSFADWRRHVQARVQALDSIAKVREDGLAKLARAASSAKQ